MYKCTHTSALATASNRLCTALVATAANSSALQLPARGLNAHVHPLAPMKFYTGPCIQVTCTHSQLRLRRGRAPDRLLTIFPNAIINLQPCDELPLRVSARQLRVPKSSAKMERSFLAQWEIARSVEMQRKKGTQKHLMTKHALERANQKTKRKTVESSMMLTPSRRRHSPGAASATFPMRPRTAQGLMRSQSSTNLSEAPSDTLEYSLHTMTGSARSPTKTRSFTTPQRTPKRKVRPRSAAPILGGSYNEELIEEQIQQVALKVAERIVELRKIKDEKNNVPISVRHSIKMTGGRGVQALLAAKKKKLGLAVKKQRTKRRWSLAQKEADYKIASEKLEHEGSVSELATAALRKQRLDNAAEKKDFLLIDNTRMSEHLSETVGSENRSSPGTKVPGAQVQELKIPMQPAADLSYSPVSPSDSHDGATRNSCYVSPPSTPGDSPLLSWQPKVHGTWNPQLNGA